MCRRLSLQIPESQMKFKNPRGHKHSPLHSPSWHGKSVSVMEPICLVAVQVTCIFSFKSHATVRSETLPLSENLFSVHFKHNY